MTRAMTTRGIAGSTTVLGIAVLIAALCFLIEGRLGYAVADEGFLWYGIHAVREGHIPFGDFQSYGPARYYLGAAVAAVIGDGPLSSRVAAYIALFVLLAVAARIALRRTPAKPVAVIGLLVVVSIWAGPWWKLFDHAMLAVATAAAVDVAHKPGRRSFFLYGLTTGLALWVGVNHALYVGVGGILLVIYLLARRRLAAVAPSVASATVGLLVSTAPILAALLVSPVVREGAGAFVSRLRDVGTNAPLPYPWLWDVFPAPVPTAVAVGFLGLFAVYAAAAYRLVRRQLPEWQEAVVAGCLAVGIPYLNHALVRSDASHLAQVVFPALMICFAWLVGWQPSAERKRVIPAIAAATVLTTVTLLATVPLHGGWRQLADAPPDIPVDVAGHRLWTRERPARIAAQLNALKQRIELDDAVLAMPAAPGVYAHLDRLSPTRIIYTVVAVSRAEQEGIIADMEAAGVTWVVISTRGDPMARLNVTHPRLAEYIEQHFVRVGGGEDLGGPLKIYRRRGAQQVSGGDPSR